MQEYNQIYAEYIYAHCCCKCDSAVTYIYHIGTVASGFSSLVLQGVCPIGYLNPCGETDLWEASIGLAFWQNNKGGQSQILYIHLCANWWDYTLFALKKARAAGQNVGNHCCLSSWYPEGAHSTTLLFITLSLININYATITQDSRSQNKLVIMSHLQLD